MAKRNSGGSRQRELIPYSKRPTIPLDENHRVVVLADEIDWTDLLDFVERIRLTKVKNAAGRPPHLRALVGANVTELKRKGVKHVGLAPWARRAGQCEGGRRTSWSKRGRRWRQASER